MPQVSKVRRKWHQAVLMSFNDNSRSEKCRKTGNEKEKSGWKQQRRGEKGEIRELGVRCLKTIALHALGQRQLWLPSSIVRSILSLLRLLSHLALHTFRSTGALLLLPPCSTPTHLLLILFSPRALHNPIIIGPVRLPSRFPLAFSAKGLSRFSKSPSLLLSLAFHIYSSVPSLSPHSLCFSSVKENSY